MCKTIHRLWRKTGLGLLIFLLCFGLMACGQQPQETEAACRVSEDGEPVSVYEQDDHADHVTVTFQKTDGPETLDIAIYPRTEDGVAAEPAAQKSGQHWRYISRRLRRQWIFGHRSVCRDRL